MSKIYLLYHNALIFDSKIAWLAQLKAVVRSQKIHPIMFLLFKAFKISEISLQEATSVDNLDLKPNGSWTIITIIIYVFE